MYSDARYRERLDGLFAELTQGGARRGSAERT
jgi:hypothetical protein